MTAGLAAPSHQQEVQQTAHGCRRSRVAPQRSATHGSDGLHCPQHQHLLEPLQHPMKPLVVNLPRKRAGGAISSPPRGCPHPQHTLYTHCAFAESLGITLDIPGCLLEGSHRFASRYLVSQQTNWSSELPSLPLHRGRKTLSISLWHRRMLFQGQGCLFLFCCL